MPAWWSGSRDVPEERRRTTHSHRDHHPRQGGGAADHRPWPPPGRPWTWRQAWHDLLFLHWPVARETVRRLVPSSLEIDEFDGAAWVGVIPFWMSGVAPRHWPALPGLSRFPELNVRTYVRLGDRPGVWFFSLDAGNRLAVWTARALFHLPYVYARMAVRRSGERIEYHSMRSDGTEFAASYGPVGEPAPAARGALEHWLTERYCLYARAPDGELHRAEIHHPPWPLQGADVDVRVNDMLRVHGFDAGAAAPLTHFARRLDVVVWSAVSVGGAP